MTGDCAPAAGPTHAGKSSCFLRSLREIPETLFSCVATAAAIFPLPQKKRTAILPWDKMSQHPAFNKAFRHAKPLALPILKKCPKSKVTETNKYSGNFFRGFLQETAQACFPHGGYVRIYHNL